LVKFGVRWVVANDYHKLILLVALGIVGAVFAFPWSFLSRTNVLIGFCLLPLALIVNGKQRINYWYFGVMLVFGVLAYRYNVRMFYFFMLAFYFLFLWEGIVGRLNQIVLFLLVFMSPFFHQVAVILGFPIRLQLSEWAGKLLELAGLTIRVEGNMMVMNGSIFTVDEACMGLSMLAISMLMGVVVLVHHYRISDTRLKLVPLSLFFVSVFLLNLLSNLLRIVLLVLFQILPEDPMHEIIGIVCLILYVMVPLFFLSKWFVTRFGKKAIMEHGTSRFDALATTCLALLSITVVFVGVRINHQKQLQNRFSHADVELANFQITKINDGVTKLYDENLLVYVKPIPEFFTAEHTPLLCWKGSGYEFKSIKKTRVSGKNIYTGKLVKDDKQLFTAWWYSNGEVETIEQFDWRFRMLKGEENFCLVNVTANNETLLMQRLESIIKNNLLVINSKKHERKS
jgi:exosortase N